MAQGLKTAEKALGLLNFSNVRNSSPGLSELARLSGHIKATALRLLTALESRECVEQHASSRPYHIRPAALRFAAPYLDADMAVCGAGALAIPSTRVPPASGAIVVTSIISAARKLTSACGGLTPGNETEIMSQPDPTKEDLSDA